MIVILLPMLCNASTPTRLKDVVNFEGIRENLLVGYGLVVGLSGTGDNLGNSNFTMQGLTEFLGRMGVNVKGANLKTKNIAAVTVTATLPAFARQGSKIDINVATIGDAKSLEGGTLLATPILGADGEVYAVAQGAISLGGFKPASGDSSKGSKGVTTNGFISNGAIVEKEVEFQLDSLEKITLSLKNPDITTAVNIASIINDRIGYNIAKAIDPSSIILNVSTEYKNDVIGLLAKVENIVIKADSVAKIIIDESSGMVTIGENVRISPIAIAQGNLNVTISATAGQNAQATPPSNRGTEIAIIERGASLSELVDGLNTLGVGPQDLITILQNIKAAGALQADIEVR